MNMKVAIVFACVVAYVAAHVSYGHGGHDDSHDYYAPAAYKFGYDVADQKSYVNMGHQEHRDGDKTQGVYYVHLPDGRLQKTEYVVAGKSGYMPKVTFVGHAGKGY